MVPAVAPVPEGTERETAAGSCGTNRQRLRDRVHGGNTEELEGLSGHRLIGPAPRPGLMPRPPQATESNPVGIARARLCARRPAMPVSATCKDFAARCCDDRTFLVPDPARVRSVTARE